VAVGVLPDELGSRGGSDSEIVGSGSENVGPGGGVVVGIAIEPWSRGGNDKEIDGSGSEMETRVPVGLGSRGGNDSEIEGGSRMAGCGVTVGSEIAGGVLESYPSSRLITRPLARAAKRREEITTLETMISKKIREA